VQKADIRDLSPLDGLVEGGFSHVFCWLGLTPMPQDLESPGKMVAEMYRVLKAGGICVISTWAG
jgi:ubiquinone/menaquinone biosynthesis C-methylase UbiE